MSSINFSSKSGANTNPTKDIVPVNQGGFFGDSAIYSAGGRVNISDDTTIQGLFNFNEAKIELGANGAGFYNTRITIDDNLGFIGLEGTLILATPPVPVLSGLYLSLKINGTQYYIRIYTSV